MHDSLQETINSLEKAELEAEMRLETLEVRVYTSVCMHCVRLPGFVRQIRQLCGTADTAICGSSSTCDDHSCVGLEIP